MNPIKELGAKLVRDSKLNEEFSAQRGLINQLFPFIYEASKRMSCRAICRWMENNDTKLSVATVARALRNPQPYWQDIYDDVEPAALIFAGAHDIDVRALLADHETFFNLVHENNTFPAPEERGSEHPQFSQEEYMDACAKLQEDWFSMPPPVIEICLANVPDENKIFVEETNEPEAIVLTEDSRLKVAAE
ncbi:MAG: hypothetical protein ABSE48_02645 [Verrucomicrobiota bacterium]|jgi:hypothetical protein